MQDVNGTESGGTWMRSPVLASVPGITQCGSTVCKYSQSYSFAMHGEETDSKLAGRPGRQKNTHHYTDSHVTHMDHINSRSRQHWLHNPQV